MKDNIKKIDDEDSLDSIINALEYGPFDSLHLSEEDEKDAENMVYKVVYKVKTIKEFKLNINKLDINALQAFETEIQELYSKLLKASQSLYPGQQAVFYHGKHTPGTITWVKILAEETGIKPLFSQQLVDDCFLEYAENADIKTMKDFIEFSEKKPSKEIIQKCYNMMITLFDAQEVEELQLFLDGIKEFQSLTGVKPEFDSVLVQGGYNKIYETYHDTYGLPSEIKRLDNIVMEMAKLTGIGCGEDYTRCKQDAEKWWKEQKKAASYGYDKNMK